MFDAPCERGLLLNAEPGRLLQLLVEDRLRRGARVRRDRGQLPVREARLAEDEDVVAAAERVAEDGHRLQQHLPRTQEFLVLARAL